jgi:AraC-like DNA-binding protein
MQQKSDQHKGEIESLTAQARLLQGRIHELQRNFNREIDRISSNYLDGLDTLATGPRALKRQQYELSKNHAETSFNAKLHALGAQLSQAEERLNRLEKIAYHVGYTDPETTQKQFLAIINEIRQYTQQIANQKGIEVVLNSKSRELKALKNENPVLAPDLDYEKIFRQPFPNEIRNDSAAISGYYQNITSLAQNWLSHGSDILQPFSNQIIDNDIFIGGTDLTVEVLAAIFRTYKVDSNIGNAVIQAIYNN